ncbi:MAG: hypothetical protein BJ554DRAFT_1066 [Olpidium bornovanus]|uniref:Uncharacterized protein n=1 Tax=Olpidium bornovanus TaxID=278681 RepID=A0A8H8A1H4_9FUNG|nr:MAG: hypothetical protein BJ554DRAFT_1066 [Olpidium bornovanus]
MSAAAARPPQHAATAPASSAPMPPAGGPAAKRPSPVDASTANKAAKWVLLRRRKGFFRPLSHPVKRSRGPLLRPGPGPEPPPSGARAPRNFPRKKKPVERSLPPRIDLYVPESKLYTHLQCLERKLDATIMRKRLDMQEALSKPTKVCGSGGRGTAGHFFSRGGAGSGFPAVVSGDDLRDPGHAGQCTPAAASHGLEQRRALTAAPPAPSPPANADEENTARVSVEHRCLPAVADCRRNGPEERIRTFAAELDLQSRRTAAGFEFLRDSRLYNGNFVEWHRPNLPPNAAAAASVVGASSAAAAAYQDCDGFEIKRFGDDNVRARVMMQLDHPIPVFALSAPLAEAIGVKMDTKVGVLIKFWNYIKVGTFRLAFSSRHPGVIVRWRVG